MPDVVRSAVLEWAHSSRLACHPGSCQTLAIVQRHFWWPTMVPDVSAFGAACTVCAQNKTPQQAPAGLLQPLPVHHRPWSHISLDFVMGLPPSEGNIAILTVVDRFSKATHFIPLLKLPSAKETAQLMVQHVFRIHGLPVDMVSDRGPQFLSQFWKMFCILIESSASLSSGFHPSPMACQSEPTRNLRPHCAAWSPITPPPGARACVGGIHLQHPSLRCHGPIGI